MFFSCITVKFVSALLYNFYTGIAAIQDSIKSELERESSVRREFESRLRKAESALQDTQAKNKQMMEGLLKQVEEQSNARVMWAPV